MTTAYPANYNVANVISMAATDNRDNLASFSNYGANTVELGAPGVNIYSTYPGNRYAYMSGTSMATPHVSGVAALVLAACGPTFSVSQLRTSLLGTDWVAALAGKTITGGRLNAFNAVSNCGAAPPPDPPPPPPPDFSIGASPSSQSVKRGQATTYSVTITPSNGFSSAVSFVVTGLPSGATGSFLPHEGDWQRDIDPDGDDEDHDQDRHVLAQDHGHKRVAGARGNRILERRAVERQGRCMRRPSFRSPAVRHESCSPPLASHRR